MEDVGLIPGAARLGRNYNPFSGECSSGIFLVDPLVPANI